LASVVGASRGINVEAGQDFTDGLVHSKNNLKVLVDPRQF
jgi:hypothetical protein